MQIEGCVALVTGGNRGLGKAYVEALLVRAKLHSDPASIETDLQKAWDGGVSLFG
jgi:NAD(P)-dependent dehydrogenase (short-subunit alcohol dehydrogenase family)